jgi:hypothetical protein
MRIALPIAALAALAASPALATGTIHCRAQLQPDLELYLVIGHGAEPMIAQARLIDGSRTLVTGDGPDSPRMAQAWLDDVDLRLDIVDANHENTIARLLAVRRGPTGRYAGSLRYRGRTFAVTCRTDE